MNSSDEVLEWQKDARCKGADPSLFFQEENPNNPNSYTKFCDGCPVKGDCLNTAILYGFSGIWGGTTEQQRALLSKSYVKMLREDCEDSGWYNTTLKV